MKRLASASLFFSLFSSVATGDSSLSEQMAGATQLDLDQQFVIAENLPPDKISLGKIFTGTKYFAVLDFVNATNKPIQLVKIDTTCGCLVGHMRNRVIKQGERSDLAIALSPQNRAGPIARRVTIRTNTDVVWQILVTAEVVPRYKLTPQKILLFDPTERTVNFTLTQSDEVQQCRRSLELKTLSSFINLPESLHIQTGTRATKVRGELTTEAFSNSSVGPLMERILLIDKNSSKVLQEALVVIESQSKLAARPTTVLIQRTGTGWGSTFMLLGEPKSISKVSGKIYLKLSIDGHRALEVPIEQSMRKDRLIKCRFSFGSAEIDDALQSMTNGARVSATVMDEGRVVAEFAGVEF